MSAIILCVCTVGSLVYYVYREHHFSIKTSTTALFTDGRRIIKTYYAPILLTLLTSVIWSIRGIILSGYALYPVSWTGIRNLPWIVSDAQSMQDTIVIWARNSGPGPLSSLHDWMWIPKWLAYNAKELCLPLGILLVAVALLLLNKFYFKSFFMRKEPFLHIIFISTIGVIFWFLSAPALRFGLGTIYGLCLGFLAWGAYQYISKDIPFRLNKRQCIIVYFVLLIIGGATVNHIITKNYEPTQLEFPHPDIDIKLTHEGYSVYIPKDGDQVWNCPLPNTPYFQKNISFRYQEGGSLPGVILPA